VVLVGRHAVSIAWRLLSGLKLAAAGAQQQAGATRARPLLLLLLLLLLSKSCMQQPQVCFMGKGLATPGADQYGSSTVLLVCD
jgi:hypothetical protein